MKTLSTILGKEFEFSTTHVGTFLTDELWVHDKWIVVIEGQDFEYSTGIGHREAKSTFRLDKEAFQKIKNKTPKKEKANLLLYIDELKSCSKPKKLNIDDVLYSLILDAQSGTESFEDFCDNFGYNEDSVKHNEIYKSCQKNGKKVKTFIKDLEKASKLFQDY